jgi:DNA-binding response OmpR family regulator
MGEDTVRRILVVEDEFIVAMGLEMVLTDAGYLVAGPLGRVDQALEAATNETFDAALLDVNVRGEEIYPVAEVLTRRGIPFAFLTGYGREAIAPEWTDATVLPKPFKAAELLATVQAFFPSPPNAG